LGSAAVTGLSTNFRRRDTGPARPNEGRKIADRPALRKDDRQDGQKLAGRVTLGDKGPRLRDYPVSVRRQALSFAAFLVLRTAAIFLRPVQQFDLADEQLILEFLAREFEARGDARQAEMSWCFNGMDGRTMATMRSVIDPVSHHGFGHCP
jgi:hypothetical protein